MSVPDKLLLSDLLRHRVRCDQGIDHGSGMTAWMHPPVHRLLGWSSKPSAINLSRHIWRLDQLRGLGTHEAFVKGIPAIAEQIDIDRLPTLLEADILNQNGERFGSIADLLFEFKTGKILYYLVSRSDPRIPGTSRWRLSIDRIEDQQPGMVSTNLTCLDDLPLLKSSFRQDLVRRSRTFRDQLQEMTDRASDRLEGWLEEPPWDNLYQRDYPYDDSIVPDILDDWEATETENQKDIFHRKATSNGDLNRMDNEEDPWV